MSHFIKVETLNPIAVDSPDHLMPHGTARDNSKNLLFNLKIERIFAYLKRRIKVLDLGCSGGGFVRTCLDRGSLAVGLEGSDYSKKHRRAEWPILEDYFLFTSDITHPFSIYENNNILKFDLITSWEVMEHLPEERLETTCINMKNHLEDHGLIILSVSSNEEVINGMRLHQTVKSKDWWIQYFAQNSLYNLPAFENYFNGQLIRGPKQNAPGSFHLFLSKDPSRAPSIPILSMKEKMFDKWHFSNLQKKICRKLGFFN